MLPGYLHSMCSMVEEAGSVPQFITRYKSQEDRSKPGRILDTIKVGEVYVARLALQPGAVAGNLYHKKTNAILFVTRGRVRCTFVQVESYEAEEFEADPQFGIIHQPPLSALAIRNIDDAESIVFCFSNRPLRKDDDYDFPILSETGISRLDVIQERRSPSGKKPMTHYPFQQDRRKAGRLLETVKVGDVWISRVTIEPGVQTGNTYHKETNMLLFIAQGHLRFKFVHVESGEKKEFEMMPGRGLIHVPPHVALANKNIGFEPAVIIYFSNRPFRHDDDYPYPIYRDTLE